MSAEMSGADGTPPAVRATGICKTYGSVVANDDVDLTVTAATIHGVLGENGAGKSTLMKILYGQVRPDAGTVELAGRRVLLRSSADAMAAGVGMVHQHFSLVDDFTVAENLVLADRRGRRGRWLRRMDLVTAGREAAELGERFELRIEPSATVADLSVGARQRVEILKALRGGARLLILDEPTAVLAPAEVADLFAVLAELRAAGLTVVVITHKLTEVIDHCDAVTVLRDGAVVGHTDIDPAARDDAAARVALEARLVQLMIGRPRPPALVRPTRIGSERTDVLRVRGLRDGARFGPVDLTVGAGEIVGVAGVEGNGQRQLVDLVLGLERAVEGTVVLDGVDVTRLRPAQRRAAGMAYIAEDRHAHAVAPSMTVTANAGLGFTDTRPLRSAPLWLSRGRWRRLATALIRRHGVRAPGIDVTMTALSGGNQQKLVVGRELAHDPRLLVAVQPTRGLDVASAHAVHTTLAGLRDRGAGVLLVSLDLAEVLAVADRVVVIAGGTIHGDVPADQADIDTLGRWMTAATVPA